MENFKCLQQAFLNGSYPSSYMGYCDMAEQLVYMKLNQNYIQYVNQTIMRPLRVNQPILNETKMTFSRKRKMTRTSKLSVNSFQFSQIADFQTLWSVSFALEDEIKKTTIVSIVKEPTIYRNLEGQNQTQELSEDFQIEVSYLYVCTKFIIDLCAYFGAVWFIVSYVMKAILYKLMYKNQIVADV